MGAPIIRCDQSRSKGVHVIGLPIKGFYQETHPINRKLLVRTSRDTFGINGPVT
jgi:hypothetical protein